MQFSAEKYEKQSSYVIQSTEYNNLLHVHKVRAQSEKLLKGVNIHGLTLRQTNCPLRKRGGALGGGGLGINNSKKSGKLSDWHQLWFTSLDSSGNGHRLSTSRPSIPQVAFGGGGG